MRLETIPSSGDACLRTPIFVDDIRFCRENKVSASYVQRHYRIYPEFFLIPFYLQAVQIHLANAVKLLEA
jgi:hypothetical protein